MRFEDLRWKEILTTCFSKLLARPGETIDGMERAREAPHTIASALDFSDQGLHIESCPGGWNGAFRQLKGYPVLWCINFSFARLPFSLVSSSHRRLAYLPSFPHCLLFTLLYGSITHSCRCRHRSQTCIRLLFSLGVLSSNFETVTTAARWTCNGGNISINLTSSSEKVSHPSC